MTDATEAINTNTENTQNTTETYSRRLIITTGDKGGVGKSTFTRGLLQTYLDVGKSFVGFDADISNSQLSRYYGKHCTIEKLDIFKEGGIDAFFIQINKMINEKKPEDGTKQEEELFLLELPPQSGKIFQNFVEDMTFLETALLDYKIRVTIVVVLSRIIDSINQFVHLHSFCRDMADYVIVKNLYFGEEKEFTLYDGSEKVKAIKQSISNTKTPLIEICMPKLIAHAYEYLDAKNMTFKAGMEQMENPAVKGRVKGWLRNFKQEIEPAKGILGLDGLKIDS
ncbi:hypothetical protein H6G80_30155 [Nostoc sp. FACHB-87]|nr:MULTISPECIES: hypothetical protein [Nostocales]MBD2303818.1 hypothetical protein [Nostoc sp. FACHB-190]MBD2458318.1 hypothetical protein [Nostoc sp. FACHB-87]MBD2491239.1 hypothetical protein [Aulosira sp. FACHB-615]